MNKIELKRTPLAETTPLQLVFLGAGKRLSGGGILVYDAKYFGSVYPPKSDGEDGGVLGCD